MCPRTVQLTGALHVCNDVAVDGGVEAGDSAVEVRLPLIAREADAGLERDGRVNELPDRAAVVARVRLGRLLSRAGEQCKVSICGQRVLMSSDEQWWAQ